MIDFCDVEFGPSEAYRALKQELQREISQIEQEVLEDRDQIRESVGRVWEEWEDALDEWRQLDWEQGNVRGYEAGWPPPRHKAKQTKEKEPVNWKKEGF